MDTDDFFNDAAAQLRNCKAKIRKVLRRYFECNDNGDPNKEHDPDYTAQDAIDDIHDIVGEI